MKIYACPKCGSKNIHIGTLDSGITYGITSWNYTCKDCDYKGMPLIFYSEQDYKQFLKGLLKEIKSRLKFDISDKKEFKEFDLKSTKEDKNIIGFIKKLIDIESKEEINIKNKPKWHKNRSWWIEISISFILSGLLLVFYRSSFAMIFNQSNYNILLVFYMIIWFFIQAIILLAIIVIIEYFFLFKFIK
jgi:hypothetical protein